MGLKIISCSPNQVKSILVAQYHKFASRDFICRMSLISQMFYTKKTLQKHDNNRYTRYFQTQKVLQIKQQNLSRVWVTKSVSLPARWYNLSAPFQKCFKSLFKNKSVLWNIWRSGGTCWNDWCRCLSRTVSNIPNEKQSNMQTGVEHWEMMRINLESAQT